MSVRPRMTEYQYTSARIIPRSYVSTRDSLDGATLSAYLFPSSVVTASTVLNSPAPSGSTAFASPSPVFRNIAATVSNDTSVLLLLFMTVPLYVLSGTIGF